jgi:hypothetical protein
MHTYHEKLSEATATYIGNLINRAEDGKRGDPQKGGDPQHKRDPQAQRGEEAQPEGHPHQTEGTQGILEEDLQQEEETQQEGHPQQSEETQTGEDHQVQQEGTNGGTGTEDSLKAKAPFWVYRECKKLGSKKKTEKEETKKTIFIPTKIEGLIERSRKLTKKSLGIPP